MSWFETGYKRLIEEESKVGTISRFYVPDGESKEFIFVDDQPIIIKEHNPPIGGKYSNWMTCLSEIEQPCPCCATFGAKDAYLCGYYTIIDCTKWEDSRGNVRQFELKLLQAKKRTLAKFRRKAEERKSLVGTWYKASRNEPMSPRCGNDFEFVRDVDLANILPRVMFRGRLLSKLYDGWSNPENRNTLINTFRINLVDGTPEKAVVPFNYEKVLEPLSRRDMLSRISGSSAATASEPDADPIVDDVPF